MSCHHIVLIVDVYTVSGGATKSIRDCVKSLKQRGHEVTVLCSRSSCKELPKGVVIIRSSEAFIKLINELKIDVVLYFKAAKSLLDKSIFKRLVGIKNSLDQRIWIITIVCQQPSNPDTILIPFEIKHSDHLIFIDKTAFNDCLYDFIPEDLKSWTYLSVPDEGPNTLDNYLKTDYSFKNGEVVFGRGSSFNKCPRNVIEPFDKLDIKLKKKFIIVGVPNGKNWLNSLVLKRKYDDVFTYPLVSFDEWMSLVSSFDIGLYYLPKNAHSSIDGTLGQMMRIGLPVIVGGAPAPKERIVHGENGFIADTVPDMVKYAEMLAGSQELRESIGKKARESTIELNSKSWVDKLESIMETVCNENELSAVNIPFCTNLRIRTIYTLSLIKAWLVRPIRKVLKKR